MLNPLTRIGPCAPAREICDSYELLSGESAVDTILPVGMRDIDASFYSKLPIIYLPETFRGIISRGRVFGEGVVLSRDGRLLRDVSVAHGYSPADHPQANRVHFCRTRREEGRVGVVASRGGDCYYHWLFDVLPRAELLVNGGKLDAFIIQQKTGFQKQAAPILEKLLRHAKPIPCDRKTHIICDELIVPSLPGVSGMPTPASCEFLRKHFGKQTATPFRKLYISREDSAKRQVSNESELMALLKPLGFEKIVLTGMDFEQQVGLFSEASVIIAPHGASLANAVFAPRNAAVIELFNPFYVHWCYWLICSCIGQKYCAVLPEGAPLASHMPEFNDAPITANLKEIARIIENVAH